MRTIITLLSLLISFPLQGGTLNNAHMILCANDSFKAEISIDLLKSVPPQSLIQIFNNFNGRLIESFAAFTNYTESISKPMIHEWQFVVSSHQFLVVTNYESTHPYLTGIGQLRSPAVTADLTMKCFIEIK